ncbi:GxxExxY protein, partial [Chryseobacterium arthrosphaerae]
FQLLNYLRITDLRLGMILNFHSVLFKNGVKRIVNKL